MRLAAWIALVALLHVSQVHCVIEGDIICPDRVTPAKLCVDIPLTNPCDGILCAPDQTCRTVSCPSADGLTSECVAVCAANTFVPTVKCPAEYPQVQCMAPAVCNITCTTSYCPCKTCVSNTCGNCTALCLGDVVDSGSKCVGGQPPVNCLWDPCSYKSCRAGRTCVSEYCGGCYAGCVLTLPCPNAKPRRACLGTANGCLLARCGYGATCVPDQCNDCAAKCVGPCPRGFYVNADTASCVRCPSGRYC